MFPRQPSRRKFLGSSVSAGAFLLADTALAKFSFGDRNGVRKQPSLCLFSKPLEKLSYAELADFGAELGIEGIDLTVRTPGHVSPERVAEDLPKAIRSLEAAGLRVPMITTAIVDARDSSTEAIIKTASGLRIPFLKLGYFYYRGFTEVSQQLSEIRGRVQAIAVLCERYQVQAGFHNHSGAYVGAALWDESKILEDLPALWVGSYFDPAHATLEGGGAGWKIGLNLLLARIKMLAIKDFRWERLGMATRSEAVFGPLGQGEVNWKEVFDILKNSDFAGPISLHIEYAVLKESTQVEKERLLRTARQDLAFLKAGLKTAGIV